MSKVKRFFANGTLAIGYCILGLSFQGCSGLKGAQGQQDQSSSTGAKLVGTAAAEGQNCDYFVAYFGDRHPLPFQLAADEGRFVPTKQATREGPCPSGQTGKVTYEDKTSLFMNCNGSTGIAELNHGVPPQIETTEIASTCVSPERQRCTQLGDMQIQLGADEGRYIAVSDTFRDVAECPVGQTGKVTYEDKYSLFVNCNGSNGQASINTDYPPQIETIEVRRTCAALATPEITKIFGHFDTGSLFMQKLYVKWQPVAGASKYLVRVRDQVTGQIVLYEDNFTGTEIDIFVSQGHSYLFWVHATDSNFSYQNSNSYSPPAVRNFTAN